MPGILTTSVACSESEVGFWWRLKKQMPPQIAVSTAITLTIIMAILDDDFMR